MSSKIAKALATDPNNLTLLLQRANECRLAGLYHDAMYFIQRLHKINPDVALSWNLLGDIHKDISSSNPIEKAKYQMNAARCYERASQLAPNNADFVNNLGAMLTNMGQPLRAGPKFAKAIVLNRGHVLAHENLATCLYEQGDIQGAMKAWGMAIRLTDNKKKAATMHTRYMMAKMVLESDPSRSAEDFGNVVALYYGSHYPQSPLARSKKTGKIRVGFVSPDFCRHSASLSFGPLLEKYDRDRFEVYAYSDTHSPDDKTKHFIDCVDCFRGIGVMSDLQVYRLIRSDKIDVLIDLAGHTANNRLFVFAKRAAPVQMTGLGFGHTTGLKTMDYIFTDRYAMPASLQEAINESPIFLKSFMHWSLPDMDIDRGSPYAINRHITFGSGNAMFKITSEVIDLWAWILRTIPDSRLIIKNPMMNDQALRIKIQHQFNKHDVSSERLMFMGKTSHLDHLKFYNQIDIALDPFYYQGGMTTCEALFMGKPVVALDAGTLAGSSVLKNAGMGVAGDKEEYIAMANNLSKKIMEGDPRLHPNRILGAMNDSPVRDSVGFVSGVYDAIERIVRS